MALFSSGVRLMMGLLLQNEESYLLWTILSNKKEFDFNFILLLNSCLLPRLYKNFSWDANRHLPAKTLFR